MPKLVDGVVVGLSSDAVALGRFQRGGVSGYVAATMAGAVMRATRCEAVEDERRHYETKWLGVSCGETRVAERP